MSITFNSYPQNQRTHGVFAEIDPQESGGTGNQRTLILGQMLPIGTATPDMPILGTGLSAANLAFGVGSQLALMYGQYLGQDAFGEVWLAPQPNPAAGVAATGTVTFSGTTTASGTVSIYVAGQLQALPVAAGTAAAAVATGWAAVVNDDVDLPVTATVAGGVVTLTARNTGLLGNEIDVRANYLGTAGGQITPPGLTVAISTPQLTGGAGVPSADVATTLANLGEQAFDFIVCPYTDTTTLGLLSAFLNATTGRWSWDQQIYGGAFTAVRGTTAVLTTFGTGRNDYTISGMGFYDSPTPAWLWAADYAGAAAVSLRADPALPLQELVLNVLAPPVQSRFNISIRNTLLFDGISTFRVNAAGQVIIDQAITFYQTDASGADDTTWLYVETPYSLVALVRDMRNFLQTTYGRKKLVADGSNLAGGSNMVTSQTILAAMLGRYQSYCTAGRAQDYAAFKAGAKSENAGGGRVNLLAPFTLDDQLRQIAMKINFIANS